MPNNAHFLQSGTENNGERQRTGRSPVRHKGRGPTGPAQPTRTKKRSGSGGRRGLEAAHGSTRRVPVPVRPILRENGAEATAEGAVEDCHEDTGENCRVTTNDGQNGKDVTLNLDRH